MTYFDLHPSPEDTEEDFEEDDIHSGPVPSVLIGNQIIWIFAADGEMLARFGLFGADIHARSPEHGEGEGGCLFSCSGRPNAGDWCRFIAVLRDCLHIDLHDMEVPGFCVN